MMLFEQQERQRATKKASATCIYKNMQQIYQVVDSILDGLAPILVVGCGLHAVVAHRRKELMARNLVLLGILVSM